MKTNEEVNVKFDNNRHSVFLIFFNAYFLRERERESGVGGERERERERKRERESEAGSRLRAISTVSDTGLELMNCEMMT